MKEFCTIFQIIPISDVDSFENNQITLIPDKNFDELSADIISLDVKNNTSGAGIVYAINQNITIDKVSGTIANKYGYGRSVIIKLNLTDGSFLFLGSLDYPVIALLTHNTQKDILSINLTTTVNPII